MKINLYLPLAAKENTQKAQPGDKWSDGFVAGGEHVLETVSQLLEQHFSDPALDSFRKDFYELYYNNLQPEYQPQSVELPKRKIEATFVAEADYELGCFWTAQTYGKLNGEWMATGGGPLAGNPQTEKEVRTVLLKMVAY
jgi:hypothetical protein